MPAVSIVMSVYNGARFVEQTVHSVLAQTLQDFEFIIIDDGSRDGSAEILERLAAQDSRIRLVRQENRGLIASLNRGIELTQAEYIARIDADDLMMPERLAVQAAFLDAYPEVGVVSSNADTIDAEGNVIGQWVKPSSDTALRWHLLFSPPMMHPSVMYRKSVVVAAGMYATDAPHAEDFDLWVRLSPVTTFHNLPQKLTQRRKWEEQITAAKAKEVEETSCVICAKYMRLVLGNQASEYRGGLRHLAAAMNGNLNVKSIVEDMDVILMIKVYEKMVSAYGDIEYINRNFRNRSYYLIKSKNIDSFLLELRIALKSGLGVLFWVRNKLKNLF